MRKIIEYKNLKIGLRTNDEILYEKLVKDYSNIFSFNQYSDLKFNIINVNVFQNIETYDKYLCEIKKNKRMKEVFFFKNEIIIIIDNVNAKVFIIYDRLTDNKVRCIEKVILEVFKMLFKNNGFSIFRGACVSRGNSGILIIEENIGDRIPILLRIIRRRV